MAEETAFNYSASRRGFYWQYNFPCEGLCKATFTRSDVVMEGLYTHLHRKAAGYTSVATNINQVVGENTPE